MSSGNFAVVFKMQAPTGEYHALKCFLRDQEERSERYQMIAEELQYVQSTYLVKFRYLESELFVDVPNTEGEEYPVLLMDWVDGIPLDQYLKTIINKIYEKDLLAYRFSLLARWLVTQPFAHGDLKPDNICVRRDGSLVLLDYDGMYVPALSGRKPLEQGSPHYRHPLRSTLPFDEHIDDYSLSLILLSLRAIALDETLYVRYSSSEYLLLSEQDQLNPYTSPVFKELNHLVLSLDFIDSYHTYLKSLHNTTYYLEARNFQLLAPILMYRRAAEMGDPKGMYKLGVCYNFGWITRDEAKAVEWYQKAAEAGDADAMCALGRCYRDGEGGLTKDESKAVEWYQKAAEAGNATAMRSLGYLYDYGLAGLTWDKVKAVEWYQKAAEAGDAEAMYNLGASYEYGMGGLTKDTSKAVEWYRKAAEGGRNAAAIRLQKLGENHP
ncbi:Sel1-like repeat-containing protein kinase family protein [Porphyromonas bobii]|uniref:Sel1-like repeat-containing protein kinase family protein n=1 Tax=Porphyromonas bobii TaxID=2811780 RepID=UPI001C001565|nr:Sel1-like repeat-containing protein kinase family protein [Porphyromonas bobii]